MGSTSTAYYPGVGGAMGAAANPAPAASVQQVQAPASVASLVQPLAGGIASRNNAAANQQVGSAARAMGGDTTSPAFQFLAGMAKTGAAGNTGNQISNLQFQAATTAANQQLSAEQSNQTAANTAQQIANNFASSQQQNAISNQNSQIAGINDTKIGGGLTSPAAQAAAAVTGFTPEAPLVPLGNGVTSWQPATGPGTVNYSSWG